MVFGIRLLKSTFDAKNLVCRLSWSISSNFAAVYFWNVHRTQKSQKEP